MSRARVVPVLRSLARAPGYMVTAVLLLALAIGTALPILGLVRAWLRDERIYANPRGVLGLERTAGIDAWTPTMRSPATIQTADLESLLLTLGAIALLVVAIAAINLMVLVLSRAAATRRPRAVRVALGSGPVRLAARQLAESAVVAVVGVALGLLLALGSSSVLRATWPAALPRWSGPRLDPAALLVGAGIPILGVMLTSLIESSIRPMRAVIGDIGAARATAGPAEGALRRDLVVLAVAGSAALLTNAGLLAGAALPSPRAGPRVDVSDTWILALDLRTMGEPSRRLAVQRALIDSIAADPAVASASLAAPGAWAGLGVLDADLVDCGGCKFQGAYVPLPLAELQHVVVGPDYFSTLRIPVQRGREFTTADGPRASRVAIIDETLATHFAVDPIGRSIQIGGLAGDWYRIVGVTGAVGPRGIGTGGPPRPTVYLSALQHPPRVARMIARDAGGATAQAVPLERKLRAFSQPLRWLSCLFVTLAAVAALLATLAVHGVMSFSVRRRARELGVRLALGASPGSVRRLVIGEGLALSAAGLVIGSTSALGIARYLQQVFPGVDPFDLRAHAASALLLLAAAVLGTWPVARRAARLDPIASLGID
ncbi:MAG: FtsX-like permease family protein [Longimicrobiales bacterium]